MSLIEILKVIVLGIVEGITEWLPISSTGHLILVDEFLKLKATEEFKEMFDVVIQLGAILAVIVIYFKKLWPVDRENAEHKVAWNKDKLILWGKILIACIPAAVIGILFDDTIDKYFYNPYVVSITLIIYGIAFIIIEVLHKGKKFKITSLGKMSIKTALIIGVFQVLALIPGTSRSGATIVGAMLIGTDRTTAAEFTFYLAIPVMLGASLLKMVKFILGGGVLGSAEIIYLLVGMAVAFIVSIIVIKFLMAYIKKHDFKVFGIYRIILGIAVLVFFAVK